MQFVAFSIVFVTPNDLAHDFYYSLQQTLFFILLLDYPLGQIKSKF